MVIIIGFVVGFYGIFNPVKAFNDKPLSETFEGIISGFFCSLGASILYSLTPKPLAPIIPFVSTIYLVNLLFKDISGVPRSINRISINIEPS